MTTTIDYSSRTDHQTGSIAYVYIISAIAAVGGLLFGFDTAIIAGAIEFVRSEFGLNAQQEGWVVSSLLVGCMIGAAAAGTLIEESDLRPSITVREGEGPKIIREMIAANPNIAALVLGAAASGAPGALIAHFSGTDAGALPVPVMIIPGSLTSEAIDRLS